MIVRLHADCISLELPYRLLAEIKQIPGRWFDPPTKTWRLPNTGAAAYRACVLIKESGLDVAQIDPEVKRMAMAFLKRRELVARPEDAFPAITENAVHRRHQSKAAHIMGDADAIYLPWLPGYGKTLPVITAVCRYGLSRTLVVCTKKIVAQWERQFARFGFGGVYVLKLDEGSVAKRAAMLERAITSGRPFVAAVNYQAVWRLQIAEILMSHEWDLVVLDEAHRIMGEKSEVSKFFAGFRPKARRRFALSGTPGTPLEIWAQLRFIDPGIFGTYVGAFKQRFCVMGGFKGKNVLAFRNLDEFSKEISCLFCDTSKDAIDLPSEFDEEIPIELPEEATRIYKDIEDDFSVAVESGTITIQNALVELLRLQQVTSGNVKTDEGEYVHLHDEKMEALVEFLENLPPDEPVVVACLFTKDIEAVHAAARRCGRACAEVSGAVDQWEDFQFGVTGTDGNTTFPYSVVAVQMQAGSEGIDLFRSCYMFFYSLGFSHKLYTQMRRRILRNGQTRPCFFYHAVAKGTVDEKVYAKIGKIERVAESIMDGIKRNRRPVTA